MKNTHGGSKTSVKHVMVGPYGLSSHVQIAGPQSVQAAFYVPPQVENAGQATQKGFQYPLLAP